MKRYLIILILLVGYFSDSNSVQADTYVAVNGLAWSPDQSLLASVTSNGVTVYQATASLKPLWSQTTQGESSVVFSFDGQWLATGSSFSTLDRGGVFTLWQSSTGQKIMSFKVNNYAVTALAFSPDRRLLAIGGGLFPTRAGGDYVVHVWETATWHELKTLQVEHIGQISSLAFSPDGRWLASSAEQDPLWLEDTRTGKVVNAIYADSAVDIVFTNDSRVISFISGETVQSWELRSQPEPYLVRRTMWRYPITTFGKPRLLENASILGQGQRFITVESDGTIDMRDIDTDYILEACPFDRTLFIATTALSPDGARLAVVARHRYSSSNTQQSDLIGLCTLESPLMRNAF